MAGSSLVASPNWSGGSQVRTALWRFLLATAGEEFSVAELRGDGGEVDSLCSEYNIIFFQPSGSGW